MKAYFAASFRGLKYYLRYYKQIYQAIDQCGAKHLEKSLLHLTEEDAYRNLEKGGVKAHIDFYNKIIDYIKTADINIFDCSMPSLGIGFQVEKSLEFNKPTIVLYLSGHTPHFMAGTKDEKLLLKEYSDKNIASVVTKAIEEARNLTDKRFNFFVSPAMLAYLERISKKKYVTKSALIRDLINNYMKKNPA